MLDLSQLNDSQREAVLADSGAVLLIAGPGTGKTFTLVKRIVRLVIDKGVKPSEIMVVTFTEKAARELLTRVSDEFSRLGHSINLGEMYLGTFHSVCLRLIKENSALMSGRQQKRITDAFETTYLVFSNLDKFRFLGGFQKRFGAFSEWEQAQKICEYSARLSEELVDIDAMERDFDEDIRLLAKIVKRFRALLDDNGRLDFSSIQTEMYAMLTKNSDISAKIQDSIKYIMVDEYQDTNHIQERLISLFGAEHGNICVVGDDDQGMYRFRGATIRNILEFPEKHDNCRIIRLEANYRSEPAVIDFYNHFMKTPVGFSWEKYRFDKTISAGRNDLKSANAVYKCSSENAAEAIKNLLKNGNISDYNQVAFLFRSVKSREALELSAALENAGIPVYSPRSEMFFCRDEIRQMLGCFIMCFGSYLGDLKGNSFNLKINGELREYYISCVRSAMSVIKQSPALHGFISRKMAEISSLNGTDIAELLDIFYHLLAFEPFRTIMSAELTDAAVKTRAARNLSEISRIFARFGHLHDMHRITADNKFRLPEELFNVYIKSLFVDGMGEYEDDAEYAPRGCVSFMTIHQSKGLEFPMVFVGSLGNSPRKDNDVLMFNAETRFFGRKPFEPLDSIKYFDFYRIYYTAFSRAVNLLVMLNDKMGKYFTPLADELPDISELHSEVVFDDVKTVRYKRVYSYTSHIALYDGCPTQYRFYKDFALAQRNMLHTSIGSLIHATLEDINKSAINGNAASITEETIRKWFELNCAEICGATGYSLDEEQRESALSQILRYFEKNRETLSRVRNSEVEINLILPDFIMQGVIDLVINDGNKVMIVDYKTGPKPDFIANPRSVEHYRKQLEIYAYLFEKQYGISVSGMRLYYTRDTDPIIELPYNKENIERTMSDIHSTVKSIESRDFSRGVQNSYACRFCDMKYFCGKEDINDKGLS